MMPDWVAQYIDIPFADHGRGHQGCDCYGLVRLVLREQFGLELPELLAGYADTGMVEEIARMIDHHRPLLGFDEVAAAQLGDVAHLRRGRDGCHLGLMLSPYLLLHTDEPGGVRVDDIRRPHLRPRLLGFYRHV